MAVDETSIKSSRISFSNCIWSLLFFCLGVKEASKEVSGKGSPPDLVSFSENSSTATSSISLPTMNQLPKTREELQMETARLIDANAAEERAKAHEASLKDKRRKYHYWNFQIGPNSKDWKEQRAYFRNKLQARDNSIIKILEKEFEDAQKLFLIPSAEDDEKLKIQNEHGIQYKEAFKAPNGKFVGTPDNLATKLTMLRFGLPIETMTLNNIMNSHKPEDVSDEPDDPGAEPRVQRIIYAEKPLEFLDQYHERAYGHPVIRSEFPKICSLS